MSAALRPLRTDGAQVPDRLGERRLTTAKMRAPTVLSVHDATMINAFCVHAVTEQSTMSPTLGELEEACLIERRPDERDTRARR